MIDYGRLTQRAAISCSSCSSCLKDLIHVLLACLQRLDAVDDHSAALPDAKLDLSRMVHFKSLRLVRTMNGVDFATKSNGNLRLVVALGVQTIRNN